MPYYHDVLFPGTRCDILAAKRWRTSVGRSECVGRGRWSLNVAAFGNVRSQFRNRILIETGSPWQRHQRWRSPAARADHRTPRISISHAGYNSNEHQIRVLPTRATTWHSKFQCSVHVQISLDFGAASNLEGLDSPGARPEFEGDVLNFVLIKRSITWMDILVLSR
jgi:hypothetical protein